MKDPDEFSNLIKDRDIGIIIKMVRCVLNAKRKNLKKIDMFDITFNDRSSLIFSINEGQYEELLTNCLKDLEKAEEYELCAEVVKISNTRPKKTKEKSLENEKQKENLS